MRRSAFVFLVLISKQTSYYLFLLSDNCVRLHILPPHNHKVAASVNVRLPCSHLKTNVKNLLKNFSVCNGNAKVEIVFDYANIFKSFLRKLIQKIRQCKIHVIKFRYSFP